MTAPERVDDGPLAGGKSEPDVSDDPVGVRNLTEWIQAAAGMATWLPEDTRADRIEALA
jgi:hypothetical protein